MKSYQELFAELKRRHVFKVAGIYGLVSFGVLQAADLMLPRLGLPDWTVTFMVALVVLAFPVVLIMAWAFKVTPEGVKRTDAPAPGEIEEILAAPASQRWPAGLLALVGVAALVASTWWIARRTAPEGGDATASESIPSDVRFALTDAADDTRPSLAVLPFADMSPDGDQGYFSDGITEEILNTLARVREIKVTARTSAFAFRGQNLDMRAIGDSLGVAYLIEGSVRKAGNQLRITTQLIDAADGTHLWSNQYDRAMDDVFAIQSEIAQAIAAQLRIPLGLDAADLVHPTADLEAYDLYLAGRARLKERGASLNQAIRLFESAIARDSAWAPAWAGLAEAKELLGWYSGAWEGGPVAFEDIHAGFVPLQKESEAAANRALELDPDNASAHVALGSVYRNRMDWEISETEFLRALELDPDNGEAYHQYTELLGRMGRLPEALHLAERALELDRIPVRFHMYSSVLAATGRGEEAIEFIREGIEMDPDLKVPGLRRVFVLRSLEVGRYETMFLYGAAFRTGQAPATPEQQAAIVAALRTGDESGFPREYLTAQAWMALGQPDSAAAVMQWNISVRPFQNAMWIWNPIFDPIREHPVYLETLKALNLEGATVIRAAQ